MTLPLSANTDTHRASAGSGQVLIGPSNLGRLMEYRHRAFIIPSQKIQINRSERSWVATDSRVDKNLILSQRENIPKWIILVEFVRETKQLVLNLL